MNIENWMAAIAAVVLIAAGLLTLSGVLVGIAKPVAPQIFATACLGGGFIIVSLLSRWNGAS